eukprot:comp37484_c0_seq1/m.47347 comp37484_c0_seq1/g.47347  ORF comp37484_c0_seq1/g.47347 comp37484_c0_seq1/m.47347 type:complete len:351 (-) comp37484_c0_seq1:100-1152(-)
MKLFDNIHQTPNDRDRRMSSDAVDLDSLKRRTRKRVQLEYRKLRTESLLRLLVKLGAILGSAVLILLLFHRISDIFTAGSAAQLQPLPKQVSIIVPTYKENENIPNLVTRVFEATRGAGITAELVIVDDNSNDGSVETVQGMQKNYDVTIMVRKKAKGLSSAVLAGFSQAKYDVMMVMDADLSHPPEAIPALLQPIFEGTADFALGSRHVAGGGTKDWPMSRKIISWGASLLAWPLTDAHDPMSGFFAVTKNLYREAHSLNPLGFKIALELMVKSPPTYMVEVPYVFVDRAAGTSKLKLKTQVQYLRHVVSLYWHVYPISCVLLLLLLVAMAGVLHSALGRRHDHPDLPV